MLILLIIFGHPENYTWTVVGRLNGSRIGGHWAVLLVKDFSHLKQLKREKIKLVLPFHLLLSSTHIICTDFPDRLRHHPESRLGARRSGQGTLVQDKLLVGNKSHNVP